MARVSKGEGEHLTMRAPRLEDGRVSALHNLVRDHGFRRSPLRGSAE
jgi:hypothetical protein